MGAVGERRTEQAIAVGIGVTVLLLLISGSIAFALAAGIASGVGLRTALSPNRESGLDTGSGRQDALESDQLVNFVPDGARPIALAESEAWARILKGGSDTNVWVRRRLLALDRPEVVVAAFRVEADRLGWTPTSDSTSARLRLRRAAGSTTDLVTVSHEGNFVSIVATVVD